MSTIPLVLCPGLLTDAGLWSHQIATLHDVVQPIVPDLSGSADLKVLAASVLEQAPERFALAGLSMGGYVAFEILRQAPERVLRLALLNTNARPDAPEARERRLELIDIAKRGGFARLPAQLLSNMVHAGHGHQPRIAGTFLAMATRIGAEGFIRQEEAIMGRPDSRPNLAAITCPTVVIAGAQDGLTPPEIMAEIAGGIPGSKFVVVDGAGHLSPLEQPQAISAVLRLWLQL